MNLYFLSTHNNSRVLALVASLALLSACNAYDRVTEIGSAPKLASIDDPTRSPGYVPVKMPMPPPSLDERMPNSLWHTGARAFFNDHRATKVGDILTVVVSINDQAQLQNETKRSRDNSDTASASSLLGFESRLKNWFPKEINPGSLLDTGSTTSNEGKGSIARQEQIDLRVAATIVQVLPNNNFVIQGKQQISVNFDMRELRIRGVIRPQDVASDNTINYDKIAEARIEYGGRGTITDVQQPRYGSQLFDILMPF
ncbi:MAG: flagellar basal body L-ring protein FlgH [Bdellovibrionales bacterium]